MKLLYITRKYPPMTGGMENMSYALATEFQKLSDTTLITWGKSQKYLPFFLIIAFFKAAYFIPKKRITHILMGDGLLTPFGIFLKQIYGLKTAATICGLDITYKFPPYQFIVPRSVSKLDHAICISNATYQECIKRKIPENLCKIIPCGIFPNTFSSSSKKSDLDKILSQKTEGKKVLVTVGRLVKRKGVFWFIKNVFPKLPENYLYIVVGEGEERERIQDLINSLKVNNRIFLLGKVSNNDLKIIYNTSDVFVMPNIKVEGDMEGFGIVAIEASSCGLPVVASKMEGITDAIKNDKTGILVETENPKAFLKAIKNIGQLNKSEVKKYTIENYSWTSIAKQYISTLQSL